MSALSLGWRGIGFGAAVVIAVIVAYLPAIDAGFIWDDDDYVTENVTLRSVDGLRRIWADPSATPQYYPLVHTSFWIEHQMGVCGLLGITLRTSSSTRSMRCCSGACSRC